MAAEIEFQSGNPKGISDLKRLLSFEIEKIETATAEFQKLTADPENPVFIANDLKSFFSSFLSKQDASRFVTSLMTFIGIIEKYSINADILIKGFRDLIEKENLSPDKSRTDRFFVAFEKLLTNEAIHDIFKASELYFEIDEKLSSAKILTEARPVFSKNADKVKGYIIRNILRLELAESDSKEVMVSLSVKDIDGLMKQLERAKKKTETLSITLKRSSPRIVIQGEDYEAD